MTSNSPSWTYGDVAPSAKNPTQASCCGPLHHGKGRDTTATTSSPNRNRRAYRQGTQGVSNRSNVFWIAFRLPAFAGGQKFEVFSLYSTWNTALPAFTK